MIKKIYEFEDIPEFISNLSEEDQYLYQQMKLKIFKLCQINGIEAFKEILNQIKLFSIRNDINDWKRCNACGIHFINNGIAINFGILKNLIPKCKCFIINQLEQFNYINDNYDLDLKNDFCERLPVKYHENSFLKKWSYRKNYQNILRNPLIKNEGFQNYNQKPLKNKQFNYDFISIFDDDYSNFDELNDEIIFVYDDPFSSILRNFFNQ